MEQLPDVEQLSLEATEQSEHAHNKPLTTPLAQVNILVWSYINWGRGSEWHLPQLVEQLSLEAVEQSG